MKCLLRNSLTAAAVVVVVVSVYLGEDTVEEPEFMYIPETHQITSSAGGNVLEDSLMLLQEGLESGAALAQFEVHRHTCSCQSIRNCRIVEIYLCRKVNLLTFAPTLSSHICFSFLQA